MGLAESNPSSENRVPAGGVEGARAEPGAQAKAENGQDGAGGWTDSRDATGLSDSNPRKRRVAALFVDPAGVYANLSGVDVWDEARDARRYDGPWPVVAHPPCARWSRLAGFTEARFGYKRGADGGCFEAALEHPAYSSAWDHYGLPEPLWHGGWTLGLEGGATCYVEQGRYGLPVKKATWLYAYGVELPELRWGYTPDGDGELPNGPWGGIDGWRDSWTTKSAGGTSRTPPEFRDALLEMARTVHAVAA